MGIKVGVDGCVREVPSGRVQISGVLREISNMYCAIGGSIQTVPFHVDPRLNGIAVRSYGEEVIYEANMSSVYLDAHETQTGYGHYIVDFGAETYLEMIRPYDLEFPVWGRGSSSMYMREFYTLIYGYANGYYNLELFQE